MTCKSRVVFQLSTGRGAIPIRGAKVTVTDSMDHVVATECTDQAGKTKPISFVVPCSELAQTPFAATKPYSICHASIEAEGFVPIKVRGIQLFEGVLSIEPVTMSPLPISKGIRTVVYEIPEHSLLQDTIRRMDLASPIGHRSSVRSYVHIPTYITVHLGKPDEEAVNVTVSFLDYIKNVVSNEVYPTWPVPAIEANIYVQITFALHRLQTCWYSARGYEFDITNQIEYDQAYVFGGNIYHNVSQMVDAVLAVYVRQIDSSCPYFTEYGNGGKVICNGLSKWGTVSLAQQGYSSLEILIYYYGNQIELTETNIIEEVNITYPGFVLERGSISPSVETLEKSLNYIHRNYSDIPIVLDVDYRFTSETEKAVMAFQRIFCIDLTGKVNEGTWNRIASLNSIILKLYEVNRDGEQQIIPNVLPSILLHFGSRGIYVRLLQYFLKVIACFYEEVRTVDIDGIFGKRTAAAVLDVQRKMKLDTDGIVGPLTWDQLYNLYLGIATTIGIMIPFPGYLVKRGSRGDHVYLMQEYLKTIAKHISIPDLDLDGIYGPGMEATVIAFQELFGLDADGTIGKRTWERIVEVRRMV